MGGAETNPSGPTGTVNRLTEHLAHTSIEELEEGEIRGDQTED